MTGPRPTPGPEPGPGARPGPGDPAVRRDVVGPDGGQAEPVPTDEADDTGRDRSRALRSDLDEVGRARPERAFNVGATLGILLTVAAVIFVVQNNRATDFEWLWLDFSLPLWTVLVGTLVVGALLVISALAVHQRRRRRITRRRAATGRLRDALDGDG
ncbi:MAG TPA: hypothetical protein VK306_01625 [Acidimicrobiales bacterium]|nr:hypothetical protein [Acidimicrobiales bacterium]